MTYTTAYMPRTSDGSDGLRMAKKQEQLVTDTVLKQSGFSWLPKGTKHQNLLVLSKKL